MMAEKVTALAPRDPLDLLAVAVEKGAGVETIERLVALAERVQATRAKASYNSAMAKFQAECPNIIKDADGQAGRAQYRYAQLPTILTTVRPLLLRHNLYYRWQSVPCQAGSVGSECIITHADGHSESSGPVIVPVATFAGPSGAQHAGAAHTYSQRYSLNKILGIAPDDDPDAPEPAPPSGEVVEEKRVRQQMTGHPGTTCPLCRVDAIIKGKAEYGGGWLCYKQKGGCGTKFRDGDPRLFGTPEPAAAEDVPF